MRSGPPSTPSRTDTPPTRHAYRRRLPVAEMTPLTGAFLVFWKDSRRQSFRLFADSCVTSPRTFGLWGSFSLPESERTKVG